MKFMVHLLSEARNQKRQTFPLNYEINSTCSYVFDYRLWSLIPLQYHISYRQAT